jgi:hypothetical protein
VLESREGFDTIVFMSHSHNTHPTTLISLLISLRKGLAIFLGGVAIAFLGGMQLIRAFNNPEASWLLIATALLISAYMLFSGISHMFEEMMAYAEAAGKVPATKPIED